MGSLEVWVYGNESLFQVWNTSAKLPDWQHASINIGSKLGALRQGWDISIDSIPDVKVLAPNDNLAVDDISFINCNPDDYLRPFKCDFEVDFCGWENQLEDTNLNWTRSQTTTTSTTGPSADQ